MKRVLLVVTLIALVSCEGEPANTHAPSMANHRFTPETLTIAPGEVVRWANDTDEAHTVTAVQDSIPPGAEYFSSGRAADEDAANDSLGEELLDPGDVFEWTFEELGTYRYYCIPHRADGMEGTIVVER